jgi:tetraacyldisaccharide-1-P 4'-kinase
VAHAYRAHPRRPRVVSVKDDLAEVGDEAIVCARALARLAPVVVAPTRQRALDHAAELADVVVIDGVSQTAPRRADLALLALDDETPWGAGEVVPRGDLKASKEALLEACDLAVPLGRELIVSRGAFEAGRLLSWAELCRVRVGLFLALARPDRLIASLARRGIAPSTVVRVPDHGLTREAVRSRLASRSGEVDLWLASPKCAVHLESADVPHAALEHTAHPSAALRRALDRLIPTLVARSP